MVMCMNKTDTITGLQPKYRVIYHMNSAGHKSKIKELSFILDNFDLFTENRDDYLLDKTIKSAQVGSAYTQSSPVLTLRQLFNLWRREGAIHKTFYDDNGSIIQGPLYMVGMGGASYLVHLFFGG